MARATARLASPIERETASDAEFIEYNADINYDQDTEEALDKLKAQFAGSETKGTLWVYQLPLDDKGEPIGNAKMVNLFNVPLDAYELEQIIERIRDEYMEPGQEAVFRVMATLRGQTGLKLNRLLRIRKAASKVKPEEEKESLASLLKVMQESQAQMLDRQERMFASLAARQSATPATDPIQLAMGMMAAMSGMASTLVRNTAPAPVAAPAPADPMAMFSQTMNVMRSMRSFFGNQDAPADEDGDSLVSVLRAGRPYLETIGTLLQRGAPLPVVQHRARRLRREVAQPVARPAPPLKPAGENPMFAQLRPQIEALSKSASEGASATDCAPLVIEAIPEGSPIEQQFIDFLAQEGWFGKLKLIYPACASQEAWFTELRNAILAQYEEPEGEGGEAENAS